MNDESSETVDYDLPCTRCGYNLRSVVRYGWCPGCRTRVSWSLGAARRARLAYWPVYVCVVVAVVAGAMALVGQSVSWRQSEPTVLRLLRREQDTIFCMALIFAAGAICLGVTIKHVREHRFGFRDAVSVGVALVGSLLAMVLSVCFVASGLEHEGYLWLGFYGTLAAAGLGILLRWFAAVVDPIPNSILTRPYAALLLVIAITLIVAVITIVHVLSRMAFP